MKGNSATLIIFSIIIILQCLTNKGNAKIFERCELAQNLERNFGLSNYEAAMFTCIAERQSSLNSNALGSSWEAMYHGLFQLSDAYWCTSEGKNGGVCGVPCDKFRDDDINDDFMCARYYAYEEHQKISGDGYNAWPSNVYCKTNINEYLTCLTYSNQIIPEKPENKKISIKSHKIYDNCELAQELLYKHDIPMNQVATWVCIAYHESKYNTSAVGYLNWDGSGDHGLFQISDLYWCGPGKACGVSCDDLKDADISDDVRCIKQIHAEHTKLSGDGFSAWAVYPRCRGDVSVYVRGCFSEIQSTTFTTTTQRPIPKPAITSPPKPPYPYVKVKTHKTGKIYSKCELAQELYFKHKLPFGQIATWVCIAKHESNFNTSAIGRLNWDGSEDHGLFQISDIYWCGNEKEKKACNLNCDDLENNDITDDVECVKQIFDEHTLISGDGFNAWTVYPRYCKGQKNNFIDECFEQKTTTKIIKPTTPQKTKTPKSSTTVKVHKAVHSGSTKRYESTKQPSLTTTTKQRNYNKYTSKVQTTTKPQTVQTTSKPQTTKNIFSFYLNDFGKTSKTLPTFKSFRFSNNSSTNSKKTTVTKLKSSSISTKKTTTKNTKSRLDTSRVTLKQNHQSSDSKKAVDLTSKPKNAYEYYVKYVLGGNTVTVAPYDFNYIRGLTKPTLKRF